MSVIDKVRQFATAREKDVALIRDGLTYGDARAILALLDAIPAEGAGLREALRRIAHLEHVQGDGPAAAAARAQRIAEDALIAADDFSEIDPTAEERPHCQMCGRATAIYCQDCHRETDMETHQREERLLEALRGIAEMSEHDQDDAHRLRHKARAALAASSHEDAEEREPLFSLEDVQRLRHMQMALGLPEDHYQDIPLAWFLHLADRIESILL